MAQDGIYSSRIGFNGVEDLGGGLKASFHFEGGMNPDVGTAVGFNFTRKSTVGVSGSFGEVRIGRDYTPMFTVIGIADPFGTNGVGSAGNLTFSTVAVQASLGAQAAANAGGTFATANRGNIATTAPAAVSAAVVPASITYADPNGIRANNSITYYSPDISGFSAAFMYSFGTENTNTQKDAGTATSLKLAYAKGPLTVAFGNQVTKGGNAGALGASASNALVKADGSCATGTAAHATLLGLCAVPASTGTDATDDQKWTTNFLAASYDLKVVKLSAGYKTEKYSVTSNAMNSTIVAMSAPVGALTLKASYVNKETDSGKIGSQVAVGGVYDLSKRTAVYATYSTITNEAGYGNTVGSSVASAGAVDSKGFEVGFKATF
jgi:predicted porin